MPAVSRTCHHPLRIVTHAPQWLTCDTCHADFPHKADCPGLGTAACADWCMGGADPAAAALDALYAQPAHERTT